MITFRKDDLSAVCKMAFKEEVGLREINSDTIKIVMVREGDV